MPVFRILLFILCFWVLPGCKPPSKRHAGPPDGSGSDKYVHVPSGDAAMNAAIAKAKATTGEFLAAFRARKPGTTGFCVKKPYPTPGGSFEHMWISVEEERDGTLAGVVDNDAEDTREVKLGDKVSLSGSEISDWKYLDGHRLIGGYTIRYFVDRMSPQEKKEFLEQTGLEL